VVTFIRPEEKPLPPLDSARIQYNSNQVHPQRRTVSYQSGVRYPLLRSVSSTNAIPLVRPHIATEEAERVNSRLMHDYRLKAEANPMHPPSLHPTLLERSP
jgi:hypothetical protein